MFIDRKVNLFIFIYQNKSFTLHIRVIYVDTRNKIVLKNHYYKVPSDTVNFHMNLNFIITSRRLYPLYSLYLVIL